MLKTGVFRRKEILTLFILLVFLATSLFRAPVAAVEEEVSRTKIVMLIGSESYIVPLSEAYSKLEDYPIELVLFKASELKTEGRVQKLRDSIQDSDLFLSEMIGATSILVIEPLLKELYDEGWTGKAVATRSSPFPPQFGIEDDADGKIGRYFGGGGVENMRRMVIYLATTYGKVKTNEPVEPVIMPDQFIYHPDAEMQTLKLYQLDETELEAIYEETVDDTESEDKLALNAADNDTDAEGTEAAKPDIQDDADLGSEDATDELQVDQDETDGVDEGTESADMPDEELQNPVFKAAEDIAADWSKGSSAFLAATGPAPYPILFEPDLAEEADGAITTTVQAYIAAKVSHEDETNEGEAQGSEANEDEANEGGAQGSEVNEEKTGGDEAGINATNGDEVAIDKVMDGEATGDEVYGDEEKDEADGDEVNEDMSLLVDLCEQNSELEQELEIAGQALAVKLLEMDAEADESALHPGTFVTLKDYLSWYEASGHYHEGGPWVGILTYSSSFINNDYEMYIAILNELEAKGANAILVFSSNHYDAVLEFFMPEGQSEIDFLIAAVGFNFVYGEPQQGVELFKKLNVPVMTPVHSSDLEEWKDSIAGVTSEISWLIAFPELDGRIEPVFIGGAASVGVDENTGAELAKNIPLPDRIDRVVGRVLAWTKLRQTGNADKKIALVYYGHHGGKDDIGATYLNSIASASVILEAMQYEGYDITGNLSNEALEKLMLGVGRNVGSWAPGELEELVQAGALKLPVEKYLQWYDKIPAKAREQLEKEWGPPPGNMMVYKGDLIIPGAILGNVFLGPQPMRGWGEDPSKIAHSPTLPPPHQYIAFYFWLQNEFKADAVIHLGTHGTLEWLPGRSVGLGEDDWPDIVMGNLPDIYPYIVNNPGEGTQAKRRGYAVTVDHLTPPMIKPGLYGTLDELQQLIIDYEMAASEGNAERALYLKEQIIEKAEQNSLNQDLGIDLNDDFDEAAELLHEYLEELAVELMPYGLHTFGIPLEGEMLDLMVDSIVSYNAAAREGSRKAIREKLSLTTDEIENLLKALNGEYIEPGLGRDPVRVPDVLPTGKNMVSFDPRMVPDEAAWRTGKKAADELLEKFYAENGRYPETVGVVLWAVETMRTQGESIGLILRLMGAEPAWDASGRVNSIEVTPLGELGRPRINVVVTISGLFRDTFGHTIGVLDEAFREVAMLGESSDRNYVRKAYEHLREHLQSQGLSADEANDLAQARIFGDPPGAYGAGVSGLAASTGAWQDSQELVDSYMNNMSYIYGKTAFGIPAKDTFHEILKSVEVITQVKDSLWGALDNDDVAEYLGGLKLAAEAASGKGVSAYIVNTRSGNARVQTFSEFVGTELRSRLLNPKWIEGMLKEGYAGFREISQHVGYMFLIDATMDSIEDWAWQQVAETYIFDEQMMKQIGPIMAQSIIAWNLEAARRDMWKTDKETLTELANRYVETAAQYGVVCCHHTCNNIVFNEWAAKYATVDSNTLDKFKDVFYDATDRRLKVVSSSSSSSPSRPEPKPEIKPEVKPIPVEPEPEEPELPLEVPVLSEITNVPPTTAGTEPAEPAQPAGEKPEMQMIAQQTAGEEQPDSTDEETEKAEEGQQEVKAYELTEENTTQPSNTGTKAVSAIAIMVALGLAAVFYRGYIRKQG